MQRSIRKQIKSLLPSRLILQKLVPSASNCVLLTFDDGPHAQITPLVLERLAAYSARAVFFAVGRRIEKAPNILKMVQNQGHLIGNHTYTHSNSRQPWFLEYWRDVLRCQALMEKYLGKKPKLFRPPGGLISVTTILVPILLGLRNVMWSLDVEDWRCRTLQEAKNIAHDLVQRIEPGDIILLHDDNPNVLVILDIILPAIESRKLDLKNGIQLITRG